MSGGINWLPLPTVDLVGDNREIEAYFEVLYPFWVVDSLRTLKAHHYLSLVTIGCSQQLFIKWEIIGNLNFEAYFEVLYLFLVVYCARTLRMIIVCLWLPLVALFIHSFSG